LHPRNHHIENERQSGHSQQKSAQTSNNIPELILKETKGLPDDLLKEVLDFVLFLKHKSFRMPDEVNVLSSLQEHELTHLENEFENYKHLYPNE